MAPSRTLAALLLTCTLFSVGGFAALAVRTGVTGAQTDVKEPFVGAWMGRNLSLSGGPIGFHLVHADGTAIGSNPNLGVGFGTWMANADGTYLFVAIWQDADLEIETTTPGTTIARVNLELDSTGDLATGTGEILVYDAQGTMIGEFRDLEWEWVRMTT